jgi:hypothetical protein
MLIGSSRFAGQESLLKRIFSICVLKNTDKSLSWICELEVREFLSLVPIVEVADLLIFFASVSAIIEWHVVLSTAATSFKLMFSNEFKFSKHI